MAKEIIVEEIKDKEGNVVSTKTTTKTKDGMPNRARYFMLVLYPDNAHHCDIMAYLKGEKSLKFPYQGCYILHSPESDEKKEHWHVILHYQKTCKHR